MVTSSILKRCIGRTEEYKKVLELGDAMTELLEAATEMKMTTPAGTNLTCNIKGRLIDHASKRIFGPGEQTYVGGQVSWYPDPETINGTLVFDGSIWPPEEIGLINTPIQLRIDRGEITKVEGDREANVLKQWFESWENPNIYKLAHLSYGLNPGARLTGNILEDERVFGCLEIGIGAQPPALGIFKIDPAEATSGHTDAIMLNPTVELDGQVIEKDGAFTHAKLVKILDTFS
jgi:leucyl aminopeptidase (aminopeptidase T)